MMENICVEGGETDDGEYLCGGWWDGLWRISVWSVVRRMIENICVEGGGTDDGEYLCGG